MRKKFISTSATHPPDKKVILTVTTANISKREKRNKPLFKGLGRYKTELVKYNQRKWWITVPVMMGEGRKQWIKMIADPGANHACASLKWAFEHFRMSIARANEQITVSTGNGKCIPKYMIFFSFPTKSGIIHKAKFLLLPNMEAEMIADINLLTRFGYNFKDEVPPAFTHNTEKEINLNGKEGEDKLKMNKLPETTFDRFKANKEEYKGQQHEVHLVTEICTGNMKNLKVLFTETEKNGKSSKTKTQYNVNYINTPTSFKATKDELKEAKKSWYKKKLKMIDLSYLKEYEKRKPILYKDLYKETVKVIHKHRKLFAEFSSDRETMNIPPVRLGIKPGCRIHL